MTSEGLTSVHVHGQHRAETTARWVPLRLAERAMALVVLLLCMPSNIAAGQDCARHLENGDFNLPVPREGTGNGWTASNIDHNGGWGSEGGTPGGLYRLNAAGEADSDPCIETTIANLCPGNRYRVSGDFQSFWGSSQRPDAFRCSLDGTVAFSAAGGQVRVWRRWEFDFTATRSTAVLRICGECNGSDDDFAVDSIRVVDTSPQVQIVRQPTDVTVGADGAVVFVVEATTPCAQPLSFQWQRRVPSVPDETLPNAWIDLTDGDVIMNARTGALTITRPVLGIATGFRCRISSSCPADTVYSQTVNFSVACPADFNADGGIDFGDVEAFFERWENGC